MRIIPAIDILNGKCVRLAKGDYATQKIYNENPLEVAKMLEDSGLQYLHLVDLDGAKSKRIINYKTLESITNHTNLKVDFGGGIKSDEDVDIAFDCGVNQITVGSVALHNPPLFLKWLACYGSEKIILGADAHQQKIATQGWLSQSNQDVIEFINQYEEKGVRYVVCTDISSDGMLQGPDFELYQSILKKSNVKLIASGGVSCLADLEKLNQIGCEGAIVGKALYEGKIKIRELKNLC